MPSSRSRFPGFSKKSKVKIGDIVALDPNIDYMDRIVAIYDIKKVKKRTHYLGLNGVGEPIVLEKHMNKNLHILTGQDRERYIDHFSNLNLVYSPIGTPVFVSRRGNVTKGDFGVVDNVRRVTVINFNNRDKLTAEIPIIRLDDGTTFEWNYLTEPMDGITVYTAELLRGEVRYNKKVQPIINELERRANAGNSFFQNLGFRRFSRVQRRRRKYGRRKYGKSYKRRRTY